MKKGRTKNYKNLLIFIYAFMVLVWIYLSSTSTQNNTTGWINFALFIIVAVIFAKAYIAFDKTHKMAKDLSEASKIITSDFDRFQEMLWDTYKNQTDSTLFTTSVLKTQLQKYTAEMNRLEEINDGSFRCDIEDYINKELIDSEIKKNIFNLVPGTMTGLGILGTFIGLSIGLKNFNTGNADEIANSIPGLMEGIKVAFHTSIYGMSFSLVFNYVYKQVLESAYVELDNFLNVFDRYVCNNPENDAISNLQVAIKELPVTIGEEFAKALAPSLDQINATMSEFAVDVGTTQIDGMTKMIDMFVESLNESMGDNFKKLGDVIEDTCKLQEQNAEFLKNILGEIDRMSNNLIELNDKSQETVSKFAEYIDDVESLQQVINDNFMSLNIQEEENQKHNEKLNEYIETLVEYEKRISDASAQFTKDMTASIESLNRMEAEISENTKNNLEMLSTKAEEYTIQLGETAQKQLQQVMDISNDNAGEMDRASQALAKASNDLNTKMATSVQTTFDVFDKELANITKHLSGTIMEIDNTTERVPQVVLDAYDGMNKSFENMQTQIEGLIHSLDIMQRNLPRLVKELEKKEVNANV